MTSDIVILGSDSPWTWALANALRGRFGEIPIVIENRESTSLFLRRRVRRLGITTVLGQLAFGVVARGVRPAFRGRERRILAHEGLDETPVASGVISVASANDLETVELLNKLRPKIIVVSHTRILGSRLLDNVSAIFINVHTGMLPAYRGHHGAYWALTKGDMSNCGVTVHVVDAGIDTGPVIAQARISPSRFDSYFTYHWLQLAAAMPLLVQAIESALSGRLATIQLETRGASPLYSHPTLWSYLWTGLRRSVW